MSDNLKKTIIGILAAALGVAVSFGWLTPETAAEANGQVTGLLEHVGGAIIGVLALFGIFTGDKTKP